MKRTIWISSLVAAAISAPVFFGNQAGFLSDPGDDVNHLLAAGNDPSTGTFASNLWTSPAAPYPLMPNQLNPSNGDFTNGMGFSGIQFQQPIIWNGPTDPPPRIYPPTTDLSETIRFDVYPNWVRSRWPRVANTPGELNLDGLRVPWVTGNSAHDLVGALTYYFDQHQQVQRISFQGWTGDPGRLINFLHQEYGFRHKDSQSAGLYLKQSFGQIRSLLRVDYAPLMDQKNSQRHFFVFLELNHPRTSLPLSTTANNAISNAH